MTEPPESDVVGAANEDLVVRLRAALANLREARETIGRLLCIMEEWDIGCTTNCRRKHLYGAWDRDQHDAECLIKQEREKLEEMTK